MILNWMRGHEIARRGNWLKSGMQEKVMAWCSDDQSLHAETVDAAAGSSFSIRVRTATGECQINSPEHGVERIVVERKITLDAEQQKKLAEAGVEKEEDMNSALRGLIASRSSLISSSLERVGDKMSISISHPVYLDGLTRHSFLSALADVDGFTMMVNIWLSSLKSIAEVRREAKEAIKKSMMELEEAFPPPPQYGQPTQQAPETPPPPQPRTLTPQGQFCTNCGGQLQPGKRFCIRCGAAIS
jgi:hypothetical protein